jgi:hypothetical protein
MAPPAPGSISRLSGRIQRPRRASNGAKRNAIVRKKEEGPILVEDGRRRGVSLS